MQSIHRAFVLSALAALVAFQSASAGIVYTTLPDAPGAARGTYAFDVSGDRIVGNLNDSLNISHGFLFDGTAYTTLDVPGATRGTNARGVSGNLVVGQYYSTRGSAYVSNGFVYDTSTKSYVTINHPLGAGGSYPMDIDGNRIVGYYNPNGANGNPDTSKAYGFIYDRLTNAYTAIDDPESASYTTPRAISGNTVVGYFNNALGSHGFVYDGASFKTLDYPGITGKTFVRGVSGNLVVGYYTDATNHNHGFVYDGKGYTLIEDPLAANNTYAMGISGSTVVGYYTDAGGANHAFKADISDVVAVPEPASWVMLGGVAVVAVAARCRRRQRPAC